MADSSDQTLAVFLVSDNEGAERLLKAVQGIDEADPNVKIVDSAIAEHTKHGRVKIHQEEQVGTGRSAMRGGAIGVVVGAILLGPVGAAAGGAAGAALSGVHNKLHDFGIDDKMMKLVAGEVDKGRSAVFVLYEGNWSHSIELVKQEIQAESALLAYSTLPEETAAALRAYVEPVAEELGGEEVVSDYEIDVEEERAAAEEVEEAPAAAAAVVAAATPGSGDDLTQLAGVGPKAAAALAAGGYTTYAALAEANEPQVRHALHSADMAPPANVGTWPMQASFAAKGDWQGLMKYNKKQSTAGQGATKKKAASSKTAAHDDLTQLSGIGPRIAMILSDGGVTSYDQLQHTSTGELRAIIAQGGALPPSSLDTWPTQASYAARGDWSGLATYNRR
jgi:predicted flap endonuclease-1-like 5' DNA nuclease